ncbi:hypothetical protein KIW84_041111 [Lathyrus oleraceus]|uniref:Uncharacterized protein n=1 Tax=Pisum sativum TaxID=3888 RepID=A0A9D4X792_PEA|nr:hypothetical protein KIW84_041111 [Pisum sativum]
MLLSSSMNILEHVWSNTWQYLSDGILYEKRVLTRNPGEHKHIYLEVMEAVERKNGGVFSYMSMVEHVKRLCGTLWEQHFAPNKKLSCLLHQVELKVCCYQVEEQLIIGLRFLSLLCNLQFATLTKGMNLLRF